MAQTASLLDRNLKARLERLMRREGDVDDIAKLYSGKRSSSYGRASFREIADFVAHPDLRNRGPITDRIRDMRTTFKPLIDQGMSSGGYSRADILRRAQENFRMATDEQVARLSGGLKRKEAEFLLKGAIGKIQSTLILPLSSQERRVLIAFGDRLIWNPALTGDQIFDDFKIVLLKNNLLKKADIPHINHLRALVILHAISTMHGVAFEIEDGMTGELQAGFDNRYNCLEVTANLKLSGYSKNVTMKMGLLWTDLLGREFVVLDLAEHRGPWDFAIEVKNGQIAPIGPVATKPKRGEDIAVIKIEGDGNVWGSL